MNKIHLVNTVVIVNGNELFWGTKDSVCLIFHNLAQNRLNYGENDAIDLIFNYLEKMKIDRNFYDRKNF